MNGRKGLRELKSSSLLLDSDILIDHLRGVDPLDKFMDSSLDNDCFISVISVAEIYSFLRFNEIEVVESMFSELDILNIDPVIVKLAGMYRMNFYKSHSLSIPDTIIAATANINNIILVTKNIKHFPMNDIEKYGPVHEQNSI